MNQYEHAHNYTTTEELVFLTMMHDRHPAAFELQAAIILGGQRRYDECVDTGAVQRYVRRLLGQEEGL